MSNDWQADFLERVGALGDAATGLPPSFIQVLAWLVVCDPAQQSVDQLKARLKLSAGSISMATTMMVRMGLVERISPPGERRLYYRLRNGGWERILRDRLAATAQMRAAAEEALAKAPKPQPRLTEMRDFYAWFEARSADFLSGPKPKPKAVKRLR